jgi:polyisoprenoid-binding protein YceI
MLLFSQLGTAQVYLIKSGKIDFKSDAPLEMITASNTQFMGAIDFDKQTFYLQVANKGFTGFNSPLQQEHFHENYMESNRYPKSTFQGKLIETVSPNKNGTYTIRAKGKLFIHGISQERIIKATLIVQDNTLLLESDFSVMLEEHNIAIPKIVKQKIAEEIFIHVTARMLPQP